MVKRKADFQMSMGMIVAVVFAVILLGLMISWIQGMFSNIQDLTHKTTEVAQQQLLSNMASGSLKVGLAAPDVTKWKKGETGSYILGIRNEEDANKETFYICVYQEEAAIGSTAANWFEYSKKEIVDPSSHITTSIIIKPTAGAAADIYRFRVLVNKQNNFVGSCESSYSTGNANLYGSAQFAIEIES